MFLFIASTFDAKTPSKAHYDLEVEIKQHCELFTDQYIEISEIIRSTNLREQCSLYICAIQIKIFKTSLVF